ncbi:MAG: carboxypeptidase regulatory-like domain-containing protein [Blastocatellia bacterium]
MKTIRFLFFLLVISGLPANIFGQTAATARISGVVTDAQGAVVSGATVKLIDKATRLEKASVTNGEGRYIFASVEPGLYEITAAAQGFRTTIVTEVKAEVAKGVTVDLTLQAGGVTEAVTVKAAGEVELQRDDAAVGNVIEADRIKRLPTLDRRVTSLLLLQPTVAPGGQVSGSRADQNTFTLDGLDVSDQVGFRGAMGTVVPIPAETVEQFRVTVANPNSSFGRSAGGQGALVSKRGNNAFHGSVYEYHQNDNLNANSWNNNRQRLNKPPLIDNRFGFSLGGPVLKEKLFFFGNYEGRRAPGTRQIARAVPTQSLREGQLWFRDTAGNDFTINPLTFDPRRLGSNPQILAYLKTLPLPNTPGGDGLNTGVFLTNLPTTLRDDLGALRFDYQINQNWSVDARGSLYRSIQRAGNQVDLVNLKAVDFTPQRPKNLTFAVTGTLRPNLVNEVRIGHGFDNEVREQIAPTTIAGFNVPVNVAGGTLDEAIDVDRNRAGDQILGASTTQFTDNATWSKGAHTFQFGGSLRRISTFHFRDDKTGPLSVPVADIGAAGAVTIPAAQRPPTCSATVTQNCIQSADVSRYNQLYASLLGLVNNVSYMAVRDVDLQPLPIGTGLTNDVVFRHWEFYFSDVWRMKPSFTLAYGLQYQWSTPPVDALGRQTVLAYKDSRELIDPLDYLRRKKAAAEAGDIFNPDIAYLTLKDAGRDGGFDINRDGFAPRISAAWQPTFDNGMLGRLFGARKTVIRGGYSLLYDRLNTTQSVVLPMLGVGFAQSLSVTPTVSTPVGNQPLRAGIDGPIPVPPNFAVSSPVVPAKGVGITTAFGETISLTIDPKIGNPRNHTLDFTIQRELPGNLVIEVGYVGRLGRGLFQSVNLNSAPYFFKDKTSGQTFAAAFDAVAAQLRGGVAANAVVLQPWFENQLAGTSQATRFLAANAASAFINGEVNTLWNVILDGIAPSPYNNRQSVELHVRTTLGRSNYNAAFISLRKRTSHGLTFDFNYTLSRSLDQLGTIQNQGPQFSSSFDPDIDYGPSDFDRTHNVNANFVFDLPFGSGRRFGAGKRLDRLIGGWYVSGVYQAFSGAPLAVSQGAQVYGAGLIFSPTTGAIPLRKPDYGNSVHGVVAGSGGVGTAGNPANPVPGSGLNLFANPEEVFKNFRRINLASDGRQGRGVLRGLPFWNLDFSLGKQTKVTERVKFALSFDFFNVINRVNFGAPSLSLTNPTTFGVITGAGDPRRIQVGARVEF